MAGLNRYQQIIERIFEDHYHKGDRTVSFERDDLIRVAQELGVKLPKNLGDLIYTFRYRSNLPESVTKRAPAGREWVILPAGKAKYAFAAVPFAVITPSKGWAEVKVPDATPGVIEMYALSDEQSLLAKLRYNRMIDIFTGVTCYSLQNHLRTAVTDMGQIETDEVYVGIDRRGAHYVFPVQAKGGKDKLSIVQIAQDLAMCREKFPSLICRPIAAQFMADDVIALFEFEPDGISVAISAERHYRLVPSEDVTAGDLAAYQARA